MHTQFYAHKIVDDRHQFSRRTLALRKQHLILSAIGMLSDREIRMMSRQDLLDSLRMAQTASSRSEARIIEKMELAELRRVLAIVREYVRNELNRQSPEKAWKPEFN